jgi:hypothetical protein
MVLLYHREGDLSNFGYGLNEEIAKLAILFIFKLIE